MFRLPSCARIIYEYYGGRGGKGCSAALGYSILNCTSSVNIGSLMLKYHGGGHKAVGTCQFSDENMETELPKMLAELKALANP